MVGILNLSECYSTGRRVPISLIYGVPPGSALGSLLFILYSTPLVKIIIDHKHLTTLYNSFKTTSTFFIFIYNNVCFVQDWMFTNKLKLNPDKMELMLIGNKCHHEKNYSMLHVEILSNSIIQPSHARNLGMTH